MKLGLPRLPRAKIKAPHMLRLNFALPRAKFERVNLLAGGGALGLVALGAVGWFVVWPRLRPTLTAAATVTAEARPAAAAERSPKRPTAPEAKMRTSSAQTPAAPTNVAPARKEEIKAPAAAAVPTPVAAPSETEQLVRRLQDVENRVAAGDGAAYQEMPKLIGAIARRFVTLPPATWAEKRNARALVLFLVSGGNSALGRRILSERTMAPSEAPLTKGAIAYLERVDCVERDALLDVDPRQLDVALGAQVAFVQAILLTKYDRAKAIRSLDLARLLAPGGLVEEAALRRELSLLSETANFDKFAELARQYWSRFRRSPYAANFLRQFIVAVERISALIKVEQWAQLDDFMDSLDVKWRPSLYLVMARTAAVASNTGFADLAARRALALAAPDSVVRERALLYRAAADVATPDATPNADVLRDVDKARLPASDQPLYDAVAMATARIFRAPEQDFGAPPPGAGDLPGGEFGRAENSLREANAAIAAERKSMARNNPRGSQ